MISPHDALQKQMFCMKAHITFSKLRANTRVSVMATGKRTRLIAQYFPARPDLPPPEKRSRGEYNSLRFNPFRLDILNAFILFFRYAKWLYSCSVKSVMFS